jgi:hypothetical protein
VQETQDIETNRRECGQQMTDEQQQQLIDELKADPESALGVMELAVGIVLDHFGVSLTKTLMHRALTKARRLSEFVRLRDEQPAKATPEVLARYLK